MKVCFRCKDEKEITEFDYAARKADKLSSWCKSCVIERRKETYNNNIPRYLWDVSKIRAKKNGLDFNIEIEDIIVPKICPILGIPLFRGNKGFHENSPTLDRKDSTKGYVKGNVDVISFRANRMKQNATLEEIEKLYLYMKQGKSC